MDLSKLPKLSETPKQPQLEDRPVPGEPQPLAYAPPNASQGAAGEAWLSLAVGVILILISPRLLQYLFSPSTFDQKWSFTDESGAPMAYTKSLYFFGDLALYLFSLALIIDGIVLMAVRRAGVIMAALIFTALVTLVNLIYVVMMITKGYGPQLYSLLAVAFGGYIAIGQFATIRRRRK